MSEKETTQQCELPRGLTPERGARQTDGEIAEMIARFRTPPGFDWKPLAEDIETVLCTRPTIAKTWAYDLPSPNDGLIPVMERAMHKPDHPETTVRGLAAAALALMLIATPAIAKGGGGGGGGGGHASAGAAGHGGGGGGGHATPSEGGSGGRGGAPSAASEEASPTPRASSSWFPWWGGAHSTHACDDQHKKDCGHE